MSIVRNTSAFRISLFAVSLVASVSAVACTQPIDTSDATAASSAVAERKFETSNGARCASGGLVVAKTSDTNFVATITDKAAIEYFLQKSKESHVETEIDFSGQPRSVTVTNSLPFNMVISGEGDARKMTIGGLVASPLGGYTAGQFLANLEVSGEDSLTLSVRNSLMTSSHTQVQWSMGDFTFAGCAPVAAQPKLETSHAASCAAGALVVDKASEGGFVATITDQAAIGYFLAKSNESHVEEEIDFSGQPRSVTVTNSLPYNMVIAGEGDARTMTIRGLSVSPLGGYAAGQFLANVDASGSNALTVSVRNYLMTSSHTMVQWSVGNYAFANCSSK
jgi:hypothetical protein